MTQSALALELCAEQHFPSWQNESSPTTYVLTVTGLIGSHFKHKV